jgi:hypothetical protein
MTMIPLHPKLKIAVDRLQKRYSDIRVEPTKNASKQTYKTESGSQSSEQVYTAIDVFTNTSKIEFAHMYMSGYGHDAFKEQEFYLKSRLVNNQRYPRDEKRTIKDKLIPKLVDEFAKPYTLVEECGRLAVRAKNIFENKTYGITWERNNLVRELADTHGSIIVNMLLGNSVDVVPERAKEKAKKYVELTDKLEDLATYDEHKKAVQVIAFELHDKWVVNIYNAPSGDKCITYNDFDEMPPVIKEKVALLKLASEDEILENIGVKVETQSYFLYGKELATIT